MIQSIVATVKAKPGCESDFKAAALQLVAAVRARDGDSLPMQNLDRVILRVFGFDLAEEETGLRLLTVLAGIQAAPDDLQRTYRRLLPPDVAPSPDARGLFSVLPHPVKSW